MPSLSLPVPVERIDLHDYLAPPSRSVVRLRARPPLAVEDDWPVCVPVGQPELDVLDIHLAEVLDRMLGLA